MSSPVPSLDTIFCAAVEIISPADRDAYIAQACGDDQELRTRVDRLVAAHFRAGSFLANPALSPPSSTDETPSPGGDLPIEGPDSFIGPYKLLQRLGEGGMGVVYLAEQNQPVQRKVALKIIKAELDSRQVIARFEQEQQALALMDHPNIAKIYDAGTTGNPKSEIRNSKQIQNPKSEIQNPSAREVSDLGDSNFEFVSDFGFGASNLSVGRPYFVMELVKGVSITKYCDQERLSPIERLALFIPVCQAVQHAHQKGIIHRDLKPSNVLIGLYDGKPMPKIIDFGVAKATAQRLTERTLFTEVGVLVGTLDYMAPEQAELNNLDIDTRADIYSLGVLLYELLTGAPPFSSKELRNVAFSEILRMIREVEPPKPSTKLSSSDELANIAAKRNLEPQKLARVLTGDLDWVVMKCLEKERGRRYETANALAMELQRYLADEPVLAGPPSAAYRLRKFVRRNRGRVVAASLLLFALVAGVVGTSLGLVQAQRAQKAEMEQREIADGKAREAILAAASALEANGLAQKRLGQLEKANAILAEIIRNVDPSTEAQGGPALRVQMGEGLTKAAKALQEAPPSDPLVLASLQGQLGIALTSLGYAKDAIDVLARSSEIRAQHLGPRHVDTLVIMHHLAAAYRDAGQLPEARKLLEEVVPAQKAQRGPQHNETLASMANLAAVYEQAGQPNLAIPIYEEVIRSRKSEFGPEHPETLSTMAGLASAYKAAGQVKEAIEHYDEAMKLARAKLGPDHFLTLSSMTHVAQALVDGGRLADAIKILEELRLLQKAKLGADHPTTLLTLNNLASAYQYAGKVKEAIPIYEEALALQKLKLGPDHPNALVMASNVASAYLENGERAKAIKLYQEIIPAQKSKLGAAHSNTLTSMNNLAICYKLQSQLPEAIKLLEEVLQARKDALGRDHYQTLSSMNNLAGTLWQAGRLDRSIPLFEEALQQNRQKQGFDHPATLLTQANLGVNYRDAKRFDDAIAMLSDALQRARKLPKPSPANLSFIPGALVSTYEAAGRYADAEPHYRQAVEFGLKQFGEAGIQTAAAQAGLGLTLLRQKKYAEAEPFLRASLKTREKRVPDDWVTFDTKVLLGSVLLELMKHAEAEPQLLQGYQGLKERQAKMPAVNRARIGESLERLVQLYETTGRKDEAAKWRKEVEAAKTKK